MSENDALRDFKGSRLFQRNNSIALIDAAFVATSYNGNNPLIFSFQNRQGVFVGGKLGALRDELERQQQAVRASHGQSPCDRL